MKLSIAKKMILLGAAVVVAMSLMGGISLFSNSSVRSSVELQTERNEQIDQVNDVLAAQLRLMLAAMNAIVEKGEGQVAPARLVVINDNVTFINNSLDSLQALADTAEEKKLTKEIKEEFAKLAEGIQVRLVRLIESRAADSEFSKMDDVLDTYGDGLEEKLNRIKESVAAEVTEATLAAERLLSRSSLMGMVVFCLALALILPILFIVSGPRRLRRRFIIK